MATSTKFQITATKADASNLSVTVPNPKANITKANVESFLEGYGVAYEDDPVLKTAKYIQTSETYVYPVA